MKLGLAKNIGYDAVALRNIMGEYSNTVKIKAGEICKVYFMAYHNGYTGWNTIHPLPNSVALFMIGKKMQRNY